MLGPTSTVEYHQRQNIYAQFRRKLEETRGIYRVEQEQHHCWTKATPETLWDIPISSTLTFFGCFVCGRTHWCQSPDYPSCPRAPGSTQGDYVCPYNGRSLNVAGSNMLVFSSFKQQNQAIEQIREARAHRARDDAYVRGPRTGAKLARELAARRDFNGARAATTGGRERGEMRKYERLTKYVLEFYNTGASNAKEKSSSVCTMPWETDTTTLNDPNVYIYDDTPDELPEKRSDEDESSDDKNATSKKKKRTAPIIPTPLASVVNHGTGGGGSNDGEVNDDEEDNGIRDDDDDDMNGENRRGQQQVRALDWNSQALVIPPTDARADAAYLMQWLAPVVEHMNTYDPDWDRAFVETAPPAPPRRPAKPMPLVQSIPVPGLLTTWCLMTPEANYRDLVPHQTEMLHYVRHFIAHFQARLEETAPGTAYPRPRDEHVYVRICDTLLLLYHTYHNKPSVMCVPDQPGRIARLMFVMLTFVFSAGNYRRDPVTKANVPIWLPDPWLDVCRTRGLFRAFDHMPATIAPVGTTGARREFASSSLGNELLNGLDLVPASPHALRHLFHPV